MPTRKTKRSYGSSVEWRRAKNGTERAVMRIQHQDKNGQWKWTRQASKVYVILPGMDDAQKRALRKNASIEQARLRAEGQAAKADRVVAWRDPAQVDREKQAASEAQAEARNARLVPVMAQARIETLRAVLETKLADLDPAERERSEALKRRTMANREFPIRKLIGSPVLANVSVDELDQATVDKFAATELATWRKVRGNRRSDGRRAVEMALEHLSTIQKQAGASKTWQKPDAVKSEGPRKKRIFSGAQLQAMCKKADREFRVFLALCFFIGARPESEACRLRVSDIEFQEAGDAYEGSDGHSVSVGARVLLRGELKTEASQRRLFIPLWLAEELERHCSGKPADAFIFVNRNGGPWSKDSYRDKWKAAIQRFPAGATCADGNDLAGAVIRDLRSVTSTALATRLGDVTIDAVMGHGGDVRSRYRRPVDSDFLEVLAILDGYWNGKKDTAREYSRPRARKTAADFAANVTRFPAKAGVA